MRTTIEITDEQRGRLLELAAARGQKGFSLLVREAIERYLATEGEAERRRRADAALAVLGTLSAAAADRLEETPEEAPGVVAMIVADSDVLIDALRGTEPARSRVALEISGGGLATTTVSAFELLAGARTAGEQRKVDALLSSLRLLPLDEAAGRAAAAVHRDLARRGEPIGSADCLIAGICLATDSVLLTRNRQHFERVEGLRLGTQTL